MGLVARGSPGKRCAGAVAVPPPQPPVYGSASSLLLLAPVVFCKGFHQNDACSTGTHRRKPRRCRLEIMHRGRGGKAQPGHHMAAFRHVPPTRPPPTMGGLGFTAFPGIPGMVAMVSFPWLGVPAGWAYAGHRTTVPTAVVPAGVRHRTARASRLPAEPRGGTSPASPRCFPTSRQSKSIFPSPPRRQASPQGPLCRRQPPSLLSDTPNPLGIG